MTVEKSAVPATTPEPSVTTLRAECERLRARVSELDEQHDHDQKTVAQLEDYRRSLYAVAQQMFEDKDLRFTEDQVRDLMDGKDALPLEEFLDELAQIANGQCS